MEDKLIRVMFLKSFGEYKVGDIVEFPPHRVIQLEYSRLVRRM